MSNSAVLHETLMDPLANPNKTDENTLLQGTIALPESHSSANRPQQAKNVKGKSSKGSKQTDTHYGTRYKP